MKNLFSELFLSKGVNYYEDDLPLKAILSFFSFEGGNDLGKLGLYVSEELMELLDFVDHSGRPVLHTWGTLGDRIDYVRLAPEHSRSLKKLQEMGIISSMFTGNRSLMHHFISGYVVSDSGIFCTMTLTAQTAYAIDKYADGQVRKKYLDHFIDPGNPWFGATFYTEVQGGSDLGANNTLAHGRNGEYYLTGPDKYFGSNAGIADAAIVTARLENSPAGAKGISVFLVPYFLEDGSRNYTIRRIKDKLGTTAVPTGEVEFENTRGYMLGPEGQGIYIAMEILTISRIDDAIAAVGIARKSLWEAYRFSCKRRAFGKRILDHPLMQRDFAELEADLQASLVISMLSAFTFDRAKGSKPPYDGNYQYARMLSSIAKNMASDTSAEITRYAMEMEGGIGFLEEFPLAKLHRDSIVTSIWEGTSNIQALEFLEVVSRKDGAGLLIADIEKNIAGITDRKSAEILSRELLSLKEMFGRMLNSGNPQFYSKDLVARSGRLLAASYMVVIGESGKNKSGVMLKSAMAYISRHFSADGIGPDEVKDSLASMKWME